MSAAREIANLRSIPTNGNILLDYTAGDALTSGANSKKGAEYYKGVGELPIIEQATISIWKSEQRMKDYAYSDKSHLKIIHKARKNNWYSEELFVSSNIISLKEFK